MIVHDHQLTMLEPSSLSSVVHQELDLNAANSVYHLEAMKRICQPFLEVKGLHTERMAPDTRRENCQAIDRYIITG